jgi:hypothetical protein
MAPFFLLISHLGHLVVRISHVHNSSERRYRRETDFVKLRVVDPRFGVPIYVKHPLSIRLGCTLDNGSAVAASIRRPWLARLPDGIYCKRSATHFKLWTLRFLSPSFAPLTNLYLWLALRLDRPCDGEAPLAALRQCYARTWDVTPNVDAQRLRSHIDRRSCMRESFDSSRCCIFTPVSVSMFLRSQPAFYRIDPRVSHPQAVIWPAECAFIIHSE